MSMESDLRRLGKIIERLTGDKALLDEAKAIVRRTVDAQPSTAAWWDRHGPDTAQPLSPRPRGLLDLIVVNGPSRVDEVAANLGIEEDYARRLVSRTDTELLNRGGKATIYISAGMVQTAATSIVVGPSMRRDD
jgi:hypothetical protein